MFSSFVTPATFQGLNNHLCLVVALEVEHFYHGINIYWATLRRTSKGFTV